MLKKLMVLWFITLLICSRVQAVELAIEERIGLGRVGEPVTCGVPLPEGWAGSVDELVLAIEGEPAPCEVRAVSYWPDGSLRWVHLDFQASVEAGASLGLTLDRGTPAAFESKLIVEKSTGRVTVTTGRLKAEVLGPGFNVFNRVWINSSSRDDYTEQLVAPHKRGLVMCAGGVEYSSANDQNAAVQVESLGPMRVVLKVQGILKSDTGESGFHFICRLYFYNDSPVVRLAYTFENRGPYVESSEYKVTLEGLHVELPTEGSHDAYYLGLPGFDTVGSLSSEQQEGYILTPSTSELVHVLGTSREDIGSPKQLKTDRIGWIGISAGSSGLVGAGLRDFWQMYPSSMEVKYEDGLLTAGLIPQRLGQTIDVYSGVARTHYLRFAFLPSEESEKLGSLLAACQKPLIAVADPEYYCRESMVFGKLNERNETLYPEENLSEVNRVDQALDRGFNTMLNYVDSRSKNSVTWESYGFLDWGDGMHYAWESGVQTARNIAWNHHYYDLPHMCCVEFVRSGDYRWLDFFLSRACHLMDVHVTHFNDGHRLNGANRYCPPTDHVRVDPTDSGDYTTARVYISPYANHHKTEGLFERYYLTGDERSLEVALKAADFALSFGGYTDFKQPRGAAFQVLTLLAAYECTGEEEYLETARATFELWWQHFSGTNTKFTQGTFMVGFLLEAFINYYFIEEDERVVDFVRQAVDWMSANETKKYSNMSFGIGFLAAELEDEDYLELMESYTSSWKSSWSNAFKDYALHGRSMARALYYMSYEGLGQEPPLPPEPDKGDINQDGSLDIADVISLILKGLADPDDTEADFNGDGIYSILDAVSLLIYIRSSGIAATSLLASSEAGARQEIPLLGLEEKGKLLQELDKLKLTVTEWEMIHMALGLPGLPVAFSLGQNHPNPFNPSTTISYAVPEGPPVKVRLDVYNLRGLPVRTLVDNVTDPGYYNVLWDGTDDGGRKQPSGVYFYRLKAGKYTALRKMVLLK